MSDKGMMCLGLEDFSVSESEMKYFNPEIVDFDEDYGVVNVQEIIDSRNEAGWGDDFDESWDELF